ncbi:MAG: HEAT repeat domain-containing protein [Deltaproteobacteria bacterium]|nr:HEAT repeat domain-containing protein [Deltaproteobacteria bacterium]
MSDNEHEISSEGPKLGNWGLWSLDFFEGMVRPPREAASIERFEHIGEALCKLLQGRITLTYFNVPLEYEERLLVDGPEARMLFIEDLIGFTKATDGFLEAKEELKLVRKRTNAVVVFHKLALRLERSFAMGLSLKPEVQAESVHKFALLMRESALPDPRKEYERLQNEMRLRGIGGIELLSKDELIAGEGMEAATRLILTLMSRAASGVPDIELSAWAMSYQRLAGTQIAQDLVANLHHVAQGPRQEAMQAAFMEAMAAPDLITWRAKLEKQGSELAARLVKESDPSARDEIEGRLKGLSKLLDKVTQGIPPEMLADLTAKRLETSESNRAEHLQLVAAALLADPIGYLKKMSSEREKGYYERSLAQCVEAFSALVIEHVPIARLVLQALQAHLRPVPEVPWRAELAGRTLRELATDRHVQRFLGIVVTPDKPESREHARAALLYLGGAGVPHLAALLNEPPKDEGAQALQGAAAALLKEMAQVAEPYLSNKLAEAGAPLAIARVGLDVIGQLKKTERFEIVSRYSNHGDQGVRESALRALALLDPAKGQALIKRSIGDRDFNIARTAILLMGELKTQDSSVIQQFLETLKRREKEVPEPDERLQMVTAQALGMLGNIPVRTGGHLEDHLLDLVQPQQEKKILGLGGGGKLRDKSPAVRAALCEALGMIGADKTLQLMRKLALSDPSEPVKAKARDAVKAINSRATKK